MKRCGLFLSLLLVMSVNVYINAEQDDSAEQLAAFGSCVETMYEVAQDITNNSDSIEQQAADLVDNIKVKESLKGLEKYDISQKHVYAAVRMIAQQEDNLAVEEVLQQIEEDQDKNWFDRHPVITTMVMAGGIFGGGYGFWYWWKNKDISNPAPKSDDIIDVSTQDVLGIDPVIADADQTKSGSYAASEDQENQYFVGNESLSVSEQESDVDSGEMYETESEQESDMDSGVVSQVEKEFVQESSVKIAGDSAANTDSQDMVYDEDNFVADQDQLEDEQVQLDQELAAVNAELDQLNAYQVASSEQQVVEDNSDGQVEDTNLDGLIADQDELSAKFDEASQEDVPEDLGVSNNLEFPAFEEVTDIEVEQEGAIVHPEQEFKLAYIDENDGQSVYGPLPSDGQVDSKEAEALQTEEDEVYYSQDDEELLDEEPLANPSGFLGEY